MAITSSLNLVAAQNETETNLIKSEEKEKLETEEEKSDNSNDRKEKIGNAYDEDLVKSSEDGHFNISFDDGYNGYCINYGQEEAKANDTFKVKDTGYAVNNQTGKSVGNYLKVYFYDYYEHAMKNEIVTQHTIWHFTDNFNGWRLDYDLIENIKNTASTKIIPDHGAVKKINNTTEAIFDFEVLESGISGNQNYFAYKITYRDIINGILNNTLTSPGNKTPTNNTATPNAGENYTHENNTDSSKIKENNTHTNKTENVYTVQHDKESDESPQKTTEKENKQDISNNIQLSKNISGNEYSVGILMLLILFGIIAIKYIRD